MQSRRLDLDVGVDARLERAIFVAHLRPRLDLLQTRVDLLRVHALPSGITVGRTSVRRATPSG